MGTESSGRMEMASYGAKRSRQKRTERLLRDSRHFVVLYQDGRGVGEGTARNSVVRDCAASSLLFLQKTI